MKRVTRLLSCCAAVGGLPLLLLTLTSGCQYPSEAATTPASTGSTEPATVEIGHPEPQALQRSLQQPGRIEGFERTALYAKISGFVRKYHVDIGDHVHEGQLLAELSVPELVEDLRQKEATVTQNKAEIVQATRALQAAEASLTKAEAAVRLAEASKTRAEASYVRWQAEYNRNRRLVSTQAIGVQEMEQTTDQYRSAEAARGEATAAVDSARAAREESQAQRDKAAADVQVAEAKQKVSEADRDRSAAMLAYAEIKAPYDGVVTRRNVDTGTFVQAPAGSSSAPALFEVARTDPVRIFIDVPETDAPFVRQGGVARVHVQALADREFEGRIARSSWSLDSQTRTLRTEIDLPNPDERLRPGMYATARLTVERSGAMTLPASAVFVQDEQSWVVRVEDGKAVRTPVKVGVRQGERVEVLQKQTRLAPRGEPSAWEAFSGAEEIVLKDAAALLDGQPVRFQRTGPMAHRETDRASE